MVIQVASHNNALPRSLFIGDLKSGAVWKPLDWKKIMSGFSRKGTLLRVYDATASNTSRIQRTMAINCICFSKEMAVVSPVLEHTPTQVSYAYVLALSDQRGYIYIFDFVKNKYRFLTVDFGSSQEQACQRRPCNSMRYDDGSLSYVFQIQIFIAITSVSVFNSRHLPAYC